MPDRTKTLTSAVFATALAGTVLMSAGCAPARAADGCLRVPNHQTSTGGHWYYRVDRQNQRKCWYLADEGRKSDQAVSARPSLSSKKNSPRAAERIPQSIADARAELPLLTYTEPFMDGPLRYSPEEPVPRGGDALLNSAPSGDGEPMTTSAVKGASTDAAPQVLPTAANHQPAATLPVDEIRDAHVSPDAFAAACGDGARRGDGRGGLQTLRSGVGTAQRRSVLSARHRWGAGTDLGRDDVGRDDFAGVGPGYPALPSPWAARARLTGPQRPPVDRLSEVLHWNWDRQASTLGGSIPPIVKAV